MKIKTWVTACILLGVGATGHSAVNQTQLKINTVKSVYAAIMKNEYGDEGVMRDYGTNDMRQVLRQLEAIADRNDGDQCNWQGGNYIIPGQDWDLKLNQIRYSVLQNGRIRAQAKNFGKPFTVDFDVQCKDSICRVSDVFTPASLKNEWKKYARKGVC